MKLTRQQKRCLKALRDASPKPVTPDELGRLLDTSPQGAATTASSLVTRGEGLLVRRVRTGTGHVAYQAEMSQRSRNIVNNRSLEIRNG